MNNLWERVVETLKAYGDEPDEIRAVWTSYGYMEPGRKIKKNEWKAFFENQPDGSGYGGTECKAFHLYSKSAILFMAEYDGAEWVTSIPRNPHKSRTVSHVGG